MFATIARMHWLVTLSDEDLKLAEQACRSLAARYRQHAERQRNPIVRDAALESAQRFEQMAERMRRAREVSTG